MGEGGSGGKIFLFFFLILLLSIGFFVAFGYKFDTTKVIHEKIFGEKRVFKNVSDKLVEKPVEREIIEPPLENVWCKIQEVKVGENAEDPRRDRIVGWDLEECCVREIQGYNCALQRDSVMTYCFTGNVGGVIKYVMIDGYYGEKKLYKEFLGDYDKNSIENKPCNVLKYPKNLQPVKKEEVI